MKFCCVTPCFNVEKYIEETMLSIIQQSIFKQKEFSLHYVIQDGGSSDHTIEIIQKIIQQVSDHPNIKIEYFSEPDHGMYEALAKAFSKVSQGDVYSCINASDFYSPHAFEIVAEIFSEQKVQFLTGINCSYNDRSHLVYFNFPFAYNKSLLLHGMYGRILPFVQQESTFWSGQLHQNIDLEKLKSFRLAGDFYLWKTLIEHAPLYIVSAWLGGFKTHESQLSNQIERYYIEMKQIALRPHLFHFLLAYLYKLIGYCPIGIKKRLSSQILIYHHDQKKYAPFSNSRRT